MKSKFGLLTLLALWFHLPAAAETLSEAMTKCSEVENSLQRLVCYDQLQRGMQSYGDDSVLVPKAASLPAGLNAAAAIKPALPSLPNRPTAEERFGKKAADTDIDALTATIVSKKKNPRGRVILTLSNGQIWGQIDDDYLSLHVGDIVVIQKAAFGSFLLRKTSGSKRIRVKRHS